VRNHHTYLTLSATKDGGEGAAMCNICNSEQRREEAAETRINTKD
jgi:hypothetical protein